MTEQFKREEIQKFGEFEGRFVKSRQGLFECPDIDCKIQTNLAIICPACKQSGRFKVFHEWESAKNHYENFYKDDPDHIIVNPFKELEAEVSLRRLKEWARQNLPLKSFCRNMIEKSPEKVRWVELPAFAVAVMTCFDFDVENGNIN
jgi:hypothetical protein